MGAGHDYRQEQRIVPDACVDPIWAGDRLSIAGPDTQPRVVTLAPGSRLVGVRLRPGTAGAVVGLPASELRDVSPDAADVLGRDVAAAQAVAETLAAEAPELAGFLRQIVSSPQFVAWLTLLLIVVQFAMSRDTPDAASPEQRHTQTIEVIQRCIDSHEAPPPRQ